MNAAAYTAVDAAETDEDTALVVNGHAPGWLAEEMAGRGRLVHVSTDYVFDGAATEPYPVDAPVAPRSAYGRTKATGEAAVAAVGADASVVRTAWVYGRHGGNFVATMTDLEAQRETISVVDDQIGSPTWSWDLAGGLVALGDADHGVPPLLHFTMRGTCPGTAWRRRCSRSSAPTPRGCSPPPRPSSSDRHPDPPTPCWTAARGTTPGSRGGGGGAPRSPRRCRSASAADRPVAQPVLPSRRRPTSDEPPGVPTGSHRVAHPSACSCTSAAPSSAPRLSAVVVDGRR